MTHIILNIKFDPQLVIESIKVKKVKGKFIELFLSYRG